MLTILVAFSENYVMEKKTELAMQLLLLFNITSLEEKKCINFNELNDENNLIKMKEMIPALKTVFQISKNRWSTYFYCSYSFLRNFQRLRQRVLFY